MNPLSKTRGGDIGVDPFRSICDEIRGFLEAGRDRIAQEISKTPTPIPACDVNFNCLLEERAKISEELGRLDALQKNGAARVDRMELIEEFVRSSTCINDVAKRKLVAR